jgi:hypothetical protein
LGNTGTKIAAMAMIANTRNGSLSLSDFELIVE